ncbi:MAG: GTPase [Candidatus Micrarchaeota archaeon]|nr:GTPase [Candidatus Micrarchaeota archaeon]
MSAKTKAVIIGAAGMDFHVFNTVFRDNPEIEVKAFTMASEQNLGTTESGKRIYPPSLAGVLYPDGISIIPESELTKFIKREEIDEAYLAYSDLSYNYVMNLASTCLAAGANFSLISPRFTMIKSEKPVISVCAVRTGCGKSQTSRKIVQIIKDLGYNVVAIREPMPYGDLEMQASMRFETYSDLEKYGCTIEEREEYEPYIERGLVIYSGVDYEKIIMQAEKEADIIVWDGGNNEVSFYVPDMLIVVADPLRPGHELSYYPGEVNARLADYVIINKENSADGSAIRKVEENILKINPSTRIIHADSEIIVENPEAIKGKKAVLVEDGPTITHGGMPYGAAYVAARKYGCDIINPKKFTSGELRKVYEEFSHIGDVIPAMGYSGKQLRELEDALNRSDAEIVLSGTPIDLSKIIKAEKPIVRVRYELAEKGKPNLQDAVKEFLEKAGKKNHGI